MAATDRTTDRGRTDIEARGPAAYIAEFIGTFMLVFMITAAISLYVVPATPESPVQPFIDWSVIGLVHVFVLFLLIQTLAIVSGAHFNPAVTVAMTALRQIRPPDAAIYVIVQLSGAVLGALVTKLLLQNEGDPVNYGATTVSEGRLEGDLFPGMITELIGTFFLVWAIVGVAVNPGALRDWAAFVIAGTLGLVVMVIGPLTGAGVNPARSFGPALVSGEFGGAGDFILVYVIGPVLGALIAAFVFFYMFIQPGKTGDKPMEPVG